MADEIKQDETKIELPKLDLEDFSIPKAEAEAVKDESKGAITYGFLGSGQGGGRIAETFYKIGYKKSLVLNTSVHDLKYLSLPENQKMHLSMESYPANSAYTSQQGAGKDMRKGRDAVLAHQQEIFDAIAKMLGRVDHIFITFCGGGGSGGGSLLPLIQIVKKYLTYLGAENPNKQVSVLFTLPTNGELRSPLIRKNARSVVEQLTALSNKGEIASIITIDNDRIERMYTGLTVKEFWSKTNSTIAGLFHSFNFLSAQDSGYTSFDPTDYKSIIQSSGFMVMGLQAIKKFDEKQDISKAIKNNLTKTLLSENFDLSTAKVCGAIAVGGEKIFAEAKDLMSFINYGFDSLSNLSPEATLHRGVYESSRENLIIYTLIGGLSGLTKKF